MNKTSKETGESCTALGILKRWTKIDLGTPLHFREIVVQPGVNTAAPMDCSSLVKWELISAHCGDKVCQEVSKHFTFLSMQYTKLQ